MLKFKRLIRMWFEVLMVRCTIFLIIRLRVVKCRKVPTPNTLEKYKEGPRILFLLYILKSLILDTKIR